jgi:hypothetical protein
MSSLTVVAVPAAAPFAAFVATSVVVREEEEG